jgi:hypothetical protein
MSHRVRFAAALATLVVSIFTLSALGQFNGRIEGTITDKSGAQVPNATVVVTGVDTGRAFTTTSGDTGFYRVPGLAPGSYNVEVSAPGFSHATVKDVRLSAENQQAVNVSLNPQTVQETVTVNADVPTVQTENANIGSTINNRQVEQLPETGRDPYNLVRLAPGVFGDAARTSGGASFNLPNQVGPGGSNSQIFQTENQVQVVANGQRVSANNFQLDGVSINSLGQGGAAVITPNLESVKELSVVANPYDAEDGRNSGAQVKVVTQNGTNKLHGSGLIKFNDAGLNAFNTFVGRTTDSNGKPLQLQQITCETGTASQFKITADACPERVDQKYRQFAGSLGGPIIKDKVFFFGSYEGVRNSGSHLNRGVGMETPQFEQYVISKNPTSIAAKLFQTPGITPRVETVTKTVDCCSLDGRPLGSWYQPGTGIGQAIGNGPDGIPDWQFADVRVPTRQTGDQYNGRIDFNQGSKNQFFGNFYLVNFTDFGGGTRPIEDVTKSPRNNTITASWMRTISPTMLNEFRLNFTRFSFDQINSGNTNWGIPFINLFDFDIGGLGSNFALGPPWGSTTPSRQTQNTYGLRDNLSWTHGRHALKFGTEISREQDNNDLSGGARPQYQFRGLLNFANDACCFFEEVQVNPLTGSVPNGQRYFRTGMYAAYVQDDFKVKPNLTVNLGLRWEVMPSLSEANNQLSNYILGSGDPTLPSNFLFPGLVNGSVQKVGSLYNTQWTNFAPRLGFAWSPGGMQNSVFRGGFGIVYNRTFDTVFTNIRQNTPFFADANLCCFFDPGPIQGPPPNSGIFYTLGTSPSPFSFAPNPNLAFGVAPDGALCGDPTCTTAKPVDLFASLQHEPNPYVYIYSLEFQHEVARNWLMTVGYQGSDSHKLIRTVDLNRLNPGDTFGSFSDVKRDQNGNLVYGPTFSQNMFQNFGSNGVACGPTNATCLAAHPTGNNRFNRIFMPIPDVNANFNALNLQLSHKLSHGFQFDAMYRWAKSLDFASYEIGNQQIEAANQPLVYGPSDFDVQHSFTFNGLWNIWTPFSPQSVLGKTIGGWQINTIVTAHTGFPWTPVLFGPTNNDPNGDSFRPDFPLGIIGNTATTGNFANGIFTGPANQIFELPSLQNPQGQAGIRRNSFRGPGYIDTDFTFGKSFGLPSTKIFGEGAALALRANIFNAFNHLNYSPIANYSSQSDIGNSTFFGRSPDALAGRVIELQARFSF